MDLRTQFPRSPREQLDGMDILARAIDKAQAELDGTLGDYVYWNCPMNDMLFETLGVTAAQFLEAVRKARGGASPDAHAFLADARESPEDPTFMTDQQILAAVATREVDSNEVDANIVSWIKDTLKLERQRVPEMNERLEKKTPNTDKKQSFSDELAATGKSSPDITTFADLLDLQEGRLENPGSSAARDSAGQWAESCFSGTQNADRLLDHIHPTSNGRQCTTFKDS